MAGKYRNRSYTDKLIESTLLRAWLSRLQIFAGAFPHAQSRIVPGSAGAHPGPVGTLRRLFEQVVLPEGFDFLALDPAALGIALSLSWADLEELKGYVVSVGNRAARMRAA